jgi:hypothetical protein
MARFDIPIEPFRREAVEIATKQSPERGLQLGAISPSSSKDDVGKAMNRK